MNINRLRVLRGPNLWSRHTAIEAIVSCSPDEPIIVDSEPFEKRMRGLFPALGALKAEVRPEPLSLPRALELAALAFQAQAGCPVTFSCTVATREPGIFQVVVEYTEEAVGRRALEWAEALTQAAWSGGPFDVQLALAELRNLNEDLRLGPSTASIVDAAVTRGIPFRRLTQGSIVQFGWGSRQRRIQAAEVDATSAVSEAIAQDKDLTKKLLRAAGVPVPFGRPVKDVDDAWVAARELGFPVVLKPRDGNQGKGVTVNITSHEQLVQAYGVAADFGEVMVERYLPGHDFRLLVVGNQLVAAARRDPPHVIGDGVSTVRTLVDQMNADPRRGVGHSTSLTKIRFDEIAMARLASNGLTPDSVPAKGHRVVLRNNANLSTGGTATDVTEDVHPEVAARAIAAAQMVGLHVCGVDVVCESVSRPLEEQSGGIVEVNAAPGLRMHLSPSYGKGRQVGEAIVSHLFTLGNDGRIPIVTVTGTNGKTTTTRLIAHIFSTSGLRVGMTLTDGVYVDGHQIDSGDCSGPKSARNVLMHPDVDAAVFETARGGILREGLGFDRARVAVVTNIGEGDHLGLNHIHTVEDLAAVKQVTVQNVAPDGFAVLNATDPLTVAMAPSCPGEIIFFAPDHHNPVIAAHRAQNQRTVCVEGNFLVAAQGIWRERIALCDIPLTHHGLIGFQVENVLAAVAASWGAGVEWDVIRRGLTSFVSNADTVPGRFNLMDYHGATLIADYGHNPDAMRALVGAVKAIPANKRLVVISGAGDRRDEDIRSQTTILGEVFDEVILFEDACQRGRADGEVIALLREGLKRPSKTSRVDEFYSEFLAIDAALLRLLPGDLCLILVDQVDAAMNHLARRVNEPALAAKG